MRKGTCKVEKRVFSENEVVFREGDLGRSFYRIESGIAGVYLCYGEQGQRKLTEMKPGQYFGEMGIIEARPRSTTIVAEQELHVLEIQENELNRFFKEEPETILVLMKQLSGRIRTLTGEYDEVTAFLKEKQDTDARKKPGFLDKMKKYIEAGRIAKKYPAAPAAENEDQREGFAGKGTACLPIQNYKRREIIFREGDSANCMYAVHGGAVDIFTNYGTPAEKKLTTLYDNSFFGEMGMIDQEPRSATAVVAEDNTILERIGADDLETLFRSNPREVDMIIRHLSKRLRRLTEDYEAACEEAAKAE